MMALESTYRNLVSGRWKGPLAAGLRGVLSLLEFPYRWAVQRRNRQFDRGWKQPFRPPACVISVGNLTVGGTGKSPLVAWLAEWLIARRIPLTILSRGYGARSGRPNDEALELAARLPGVPQLQNPDRIAAANQALAANPRQVLLLDDAFQHRRIARDLDIVLLDALEPFGFEHLLPRGLLREPIESLARAHAVGLSRSDAVSDERRRQIKDRVLAIAPQAIWLELAHRPTGLVAASGQHGPLASIRGQPVAAFCGIGNPAGFRHTLEAAGVEIAGFMEFADHCPFGPAEMDRLTGWLRSLPAAAAVVCTRKDLVKVQRDEIAGRPLWAVAIELAIGSGREALEQRLEEVIAPLAGC